MLLLLLLGMLMLMLMLMWMRMLRLVMMKTAVVMMLLLRRMWLVQHQRLGEVHCGVEIRCRIARPPRAWRRCDLPVRPLQSGATGRKAE